MREDGSGRVLWTNGVDGGHMLTIQNDGNIVMYNVQEINIWDTRTGGIYCTRGEPKLKFSPESAIIKMS